MFCIVPERQAQSLERRGPRSNDIDDLRTMSLIPCPESVHSSHSARTSLSISVNMTTTVGLARGTSVRCCVKRVSVTVVQCSKRRMVNVMIAMRERPAPSAAMLTSMGR